MHIYLRPLIDALNHLYKAGAHIMLLSTLHALDIVNPLIEVKVSTPDGVHICRGMLLTCSVDLPARALVCSMKNYNGAYSCPTCLDSGDNTVGASPMHRYWPFNSSCEIRTLEGVHTAFKEASRSGIAVSTCQESSFL